MDIFHRNAGMIKSNIIMAEVPECLYSQLYEKGNKLSRTFGRNAKHRHFGKVFFAEFVQSVDVSDGYSFYHLSGQRFFAVKDSDERKALVFKGYLI